MKKSRRQLLIALLTVAAAVVIRICYGVATTPRPVEMQQTPLPPSVELLDSAHAAKHDSAKTVAREKKAKEKDTKAKRRPAIRQPLDEPVQSE
ncbi:MAG: hypothetical protein HDS65_08630 [Bacteroidales bacterium]|nr:hypothetical protein [Bacteroidales bacterium]